MPICFLTCKPVFHDKVNKNLFPTSMSVFGAKARLYVHVHS